MMTKRPLLFALCSALILLPTAAPAHDVWITTEKASSGDNFHAAVHYGHPGDLSLPVKEKIYRFGVFDHRGRESLLLGTLSPAVTDPVQLSGVLVAEPGPRTAIFYASYDNGYWVQTADKRSLNTSREGVPDAASASHNLKYAKYLAAPDPAVTTGYDRVVGQRLEIVPLANPFILKPGQVLRVRVLYEGKPLMGAGVEVGDGVTPRKEEDIPRYKTDNHGVATVPIVKVGLVLVAVDHEQKSAFPQLADLDQLTATLAFRL